MEGPALGELSAIAAATDAQVIASGGVGNLAHLESLARDAAPNLEGAIVGRALYERRFTVPRQSRRWRSQVHRRNAAVRRDWVPSLGGSDGQPEPSPTSCATASGEGTPSLP